MRVVQKVEDIDYSETKQFFKHRADKFKEDNPYAVTMYQDDHPELVHERNQKEVENSTFVKTMEKLVSIFHGMHQK